MAEEPSPPAGGRAMPPINETTHALALAVVRAKRRREAAQAEIQDRVTRLQADLDEQRSAHTRLRALVGQAWAAEMSAEGGARQEGDDASALRLPPLDAAIPQEDLADADAAGFGAAGFAALRGSLRAARAAAPNAAAQAALDAKNAALSAMLLAHARALRGVSAATAAPADDTWRRDEKEDGPLAAVAPVCDLVATTLVGVAPSSMRAAYMQQSARALAAALTPPPTTPGASARREACRGAAAHVLSLERRLLETALPLTASDAAPEQQQQQGTLAQLRELAALPGPGLLLLRAASEHLVALLGALAESSAAPSAPQEEQEPTESAAVADSDATYWFEDSADSAQSGSRDNDGAPTGMVVPAARWAALERASALFQHAWQLMALQRGCLAQLAPWCGALAAAPWLPVSLAATVSSALQARELLLALADAFPPLLEPGLALCAQLATALQYIGSSGSAAAAAGSGDQQELRAACVRHCVTLRDAFMPQ